MSLTGILPDRDRRFGLEFVVERFFLLTRCDIDAIQSIDQFIHSNQRNLHNSIVLITTRTISKRMKRRLFRSNNRTNFSFLFSLSLSLLRFQNLKRKLLLTATGSKSNIQCTVTFQ